ncbi:MAG: acyltransferase family protein [Verrucomicrobiota bacterium]
MNKGSYRPEIDGLRALSVVGVMLYHADLGFSGGYVGVDVFFVISGFLITRIIYREINQGTFTLSNFWTRRIKRILPASSFVTLATILAGYIILDPELLSSLSLSAIAYALFLANVYFYRQDSYFAPALESQPLLHTWSLSVEEQFYVGFPLLILLLIRFFKQSTPRLLLIIAILSFVISVVGVYAKPAATFFLLPTRAWELMAGCLIAISADRIQWKKSTREPLSALGILLVVASMLFYSSQTPFPGLAAIFPVGGAAIFIAANCGSGTQMGRVLSLRPFVFIGLLSYSLYLWHWPLLVYGKYLLGALSISAKLSIISLTFILAYLSWKFIEAPFRRKWINGPKWAFCFAIATALLTTGISLSLWNQFRSLENLDSELQKIVHDISWNGIEYQKEDAKLGVQDDERPVDFIVWGDSHAMFHCQQIDELARKLDLKGLAYVNLGSVPVPNLWKPDRSDAFNDQNQKRNLERKQQIIDSGVKDVIMIARWDSYINGYLETEIDESKGRYKTYSMVADSDSRELTSSESYAALQRQFSRLSEEFAGHGIRIWLLLQVPHAPHTDIARKFYRLERFPWLMSADFNEGISREDYEQTRQKTFELFSNLQGDHLMVVDPIDGFFPDDQPMTLFDEERAFYRDEDHLTEHGVSRYLKTTHEETLKAIAVQPNKKQETN